MLSLANWPKCRLGCAVFRGNFWENTEDLGSLWNELEELANWAWMSPRKLCNDRGPCGSPRAWCHYWQGLNVPVPRTTQYTQTRASWTQQEYKQTCQDAYKLLPPNLEGHFLLWRTPFIAQKRPKMEHVWELTKDSDMGMAQRRMSHLFAWEEFWPQPDPSLPSPSYKEKGGEVPLQTRNRLLEHGKMKRLGQGDLQSPRFRMPQSLAHGTVAALPSHSLFLRLYSSPFVFKLEWSDFSLVSEKTQREAKKERQRERERGRCWSVSVHGISKK